MSRVERGPFIAMMNGHIGSPVSFQVVLYNFKICGSVCFSQRDQTGRSDRAFVAVCVESERTIDCPFRIGGLTRSICTEHLKNRSQNVPNAN